MIIKYNLILNRLFLSYFFVFFLVTSNIFGSLSKHEKELLQKYSLPDGIAKDFLNEVFSKSTNPGFVFDNGGFEFLKKVKEDPSVVVKHKEIPGLILKTRTKEGILRVLWSNTNIRRVEISRNIREHLKLHHLENEIIVPQKWYFHIPGTSEDLNDNNYIVVAEELDIELNSLNQFTQNQQNILLSLIKKFCLFDAGEANVCITKDRKVAIIDTEPPRTLADAIPVIGKFPLFQYLSHKKQSTKGMNRFFKASRILIKKNSGKILDSEDI